MLSGERLSALRREKLKSKKEMGDILNIDQTTYGKYELEQRQPSLDILRRIADYFEVSTDYLLGLSDEPLVIPEEIKGAFVAFNRGEFEELTQDEVERLAEFARFIKSQRQGG